MILPEEKKNNLTELPLQYYREKFLSSDFQEISKRTGFDFNGLSFSVPFLNETVILNTFVPSDSASLFQNAPKEKEEILLLRFMLEGCRSSESPVFKAYNEFPWGDVYDRNFRARCTKRLSGVFGQKPSAFEEAMLRLGGRKTAGSGLSYELSLLPGYRMRFILWEGDEEFPASAQILFNEDFAKGFSAEDRVVAAEIVIGRMK